MGRVVIGMDPHKRSATIEIIDEREHVLAIGRFGTDRDGYRQLLAAGRGWPERLWAVEGCEGVGRHLAQRLVADGEAVVDVPAKLSARARMFSTGQGRKTDATDAHSVAVVALRTPGLRAVQVDDTTVALRLLVDRRDELGAARTLTVNRLHRLLVELVPGGRRRSCPRPRPRCCSLRSARETWWARPGASWPRSSSPNSTASISESRQRTRSSPGSSRRPAARCSTSTGSAPRARRGCSAISATCPASHPRPLRVVERHRPNRRLLRGADPPPAVPGREPTDQQGAAHHGHRAAAQ